MSIRDKLISGPLGFGAAPLGNMSRNIPEEEEAATVNAAWQQGIRYFDTAPLYGAGLSEMRLGRALAKHKRDEYVLSSKVGRLILEEVESGPRHLGEKGIRFEFGRPNRMVYDYSADGTLRSIEDSLKRLGVDRLDFVWIHDLSRDFHGNEWLARFETARTGAFRALTQLRERGVIKAWGLGVNTVEPCELSLDMAEARPDGFLLAGRYTLLDHERALQRLMPAAADKKVDIVSVARTARASWSVVPTSSTRRRPQQSWPRSSASRPSPNAIRFPSRPPLCNSLSRTPPRPPSSRGPAAPNALRKTVPR
jgi:D-threo-aldose 1-dehydrogenase